MPKSVSDKFEYNQFYDDCIVKKYTRKQLAKIYDCSVNTITEYRKQLGIPNGRKNYTFNESFFDNPNIENCYWAGFLASDGNISLEPSNSVRLILDLKPSDEIALQEFKKAIDYSGPVTSWKEYDKRTNKFYYHKRVRIGKAHHLVDKLNEHWNITNNKTLTLKGPKSYIQNELADAFITGYIDGNGNCNFGKFQVYSVTISAGSYAILEWIKNEIYRSTNIITEVENPKKNTFQLNYYSNDSRFVYYYYKNVNIPFRLPRKWRY